MDEDEEPIPWAEQSQSTRSLFPRNGRHPPRNVGYQLSNSRRFNYSPPSARIL